MQEFWDEVARPPDSERRPSVRPASIRPNWNPPNIDTLKEWVDGVGTSDSPILLVEGPTPAHRAAVYRLAKTLQDDKSAAWVEQGVVENLTERLSKVRAIGSIIPHEWDLLWNLLTLEQLEVEEPVRSLIDQGHLFTEFFKAIWEARFQLNEGKDIKPFVTALSRWMTAAPLDSSQKELLGQLGIERELETTFERLDMLFFLVALAKQNELISQLVFVLDGLEKVASLGVSPRRQRSKELLDFFLVADRWARLGAPIGFLLGYSNEHRPLDSLERSNAKLGKRLRSYKTV